MIASFSFSSTVHVTQWSNYLTQRAEFLTRDSDLRQAEFRGISWLRKSLEITHFTQCVLISLRKG